MARRSLSEIMASPSDIDEGRLDATTDEDIRRYKAVEGYSADYRPTGPVLEVPAVADLRERMELTQGAFASLLRIPVATLRNWEQGRKMPDPAARTLLALIAADPANARRILNGEAKQSHASQIEISEIVLLPVTFAVAASVSASEPANLNHISLRAMA